MATPKLPLPREHGAWGLLLQPFLAGAILAGKWTWLLLVALALTLCGFVLREPLTVLARQWFVWRQPNPQTRVAARWLAVELAIATACAIPLLLILPLPPLAALLGAAVALTLLAVWATIKNRQRSTVLQIVSALGLGSTALYSVLTATGRLPDWVWILWALLSVHAIGAILVVRARLRLRASHGQPVRDRTTLTPLAVLAAACLLAAWRPQLAIPMLFSAAALWFELYRLRQPGGVDQPLRTVGFRALGTSLAHTALTIAVLWPAARP